MSRPVHMSGVVALGVLIGLVTAADAQTTHRHARRAAPEGRQIVVHAGESYLTLGTWAPVGAHNNYVLSSFGGGSTTFTPFIDHTVVGVMGLDRLPNNYTVPNCCVP